MNVGTIGSGKQKKPSDSMKLINWAKPSAREAAWQLKSPATRSGESSTVVTKSGKTRSWSSLKLYTNGNGGTYRLKTKNDPGNSREAPGKRVSFNKRHSIEQSSTKTSSTQKELRIAKGISTPRPPTGRPDGGLIASRLKN
jgi:hypothetical protein